MQHIAIVGAGLGGLVSGALLAQDGYKVTLLEQHNIVGGCATTFQRKGGFICEVGLHEMDGLYTDGLKNEIFTKLGVYENVEFVKPKEFFHIRTDSINFSMPDNVDEAKAKLIQHYPNEANGIEKYFTLLKEITKDVENLSNLQWYDYPIFPLKFHRILRYKNRSVQDVFDTLFHEEEVKIILNANLGYYHDNTQELSFLLHALAQYSYFSGQGWFIKGGSQKLSDYLASVIIQNNGEIITKANVVEIKSSTLKYEYKNEMLTLSFDKIISNLSPMQTYKMANIEYKNTKQLANSILTIYLGFSKNLKNVYGTKAYSNFFLKDIKKLDDMNKIKNVDTKERGFVFVDYSQIDSALTKDKDKSFGVFTTTDYLQDWKNLTQEEYREKKEKVKEAFLDELEKYYPNIKDLVEYSEVATPKTMQRYLKTPNATAYGFAPTVQQFFKVPKSQSKKMKNLYFVGQWVIGGGFSPAIHSGKLAYDKIVKSV